jgi:mannitol/fructose-specific phosphotransferase system IIA component (Ntr-type)
MKKKYFSFRIKDRWLKMDKSIMFVNKALKDKLDVVTYLCKKVVEYGYTNEHYLNSVLDRMALAPLNMLDGSEKGIAVIHTASFDDVLKPGLAVLTLSEAILWDQIFVDVVFVLMVKDSSMQIPMEFHTSIVTNETIMNNIRAARNKNELFELLNRRGPI